MKAFFLTVATLLFYINAFGDCGGRYQNRVFDSVQVTHKVQFGLNKTSSGKMQKLFMDIYEPYGDTEINRPIVMLAHGGAFIDLIDQRSPDIVYLATDLAKRGYVVASFDYREEANFSSLQYESRMVKAVIRSVQDGKAAIGFMKNNGIAENTWRIDPEQMILGGVSAGAIMADHLVYIKSLEQLTPQWQTWVEMIGGMQGTTGPAGYNEDLLGLINISGAIGNPNWVTSNPIPIMSIHGHLDPIVPYMEGKPLGIPTLPDMFGSYFINRVADSMGYSTILYDYPDRGHVPFMNITDLSDLDFSQGIDGLFNQTILDTTYEQIARFCYSLIRCGNTPTPIKDNTTTNQLTIYPNPGSGTFSVEISSNVPAQLKIISLSGEVVCQKIYLGKVEITRNEWNSIPGMYIVLATNILTGQTIGLSKFIVN